MSEVSTLSRQDAADLATAKAEAEFLAIMLADCVAVLHQVPINLLPGKVDMMLFSALDAPLGPGRTELAERAAAIRDIALAEAEARARRAALEEAAKIADDCYFGSTAATAIRALANTTPETRQPETVSLERVRHVKRGTEYEVLGEAEAQVAALAIFPIKGPPYTYLREGDRLTVYRCTKTGKLWCRLTNEFRDGRFMTIAPPEPPARIAHLDREDGR